jgi:hypothetical protein
MSDKGESEFPPSSNCLLHGQPGYSGIRLSGSLKDKQYETGVFDLEAWLCLQSTGRGIFGPGVDRTLIEINRIPASGAGVGPIEFIGEDLFFLTALRALTNE